ncbi:hypothetical protein [Methylobacterium oryzae]|uniref:hypothetical protein n=1 Tax=Methylobacterium oryzae TaxID=334852 RepID=UPI002F3575BE
MTSEGPYRVKDREPGSPGSQSVPAAALVAVLFDHGVFVDVVVVVMHDRTIAVTLLDDPVGVLDVAMMVAMDRDAAGADIDVLGKRADGSECQGDGSGEGCNPDLHPVTPGFENAPKMHLPPKPFPDFLALIDVLSALARMGVEIAT